MKKVFLILMGLLLMSPTFAQTGSPLTVKGNVVDEPNTPLIGATVAVKGTSNGTITDLDGNFELAATSDAVLVFTYVSYISKEVEVDGKSNLGTIVMEEDSKALDQVVVIGYGTQNKVDLTGSVAIVDADEMKKVRWLVCRLLPTVSPVPTPMCVSAVLVRLAAPHLYML